MSYEPNGDDPNYIVDPDPCARCGEVKDDSRELHPHSKLCKRLPVTICFDCENELKEMFSMFESDEWKTIRGDDLSFVLDLMEELPDPPRKQYYLSKERQICQELDRSRGS